MYYRFILKQLDYSRSRILCVILELIIRHFVGYQNVFVDNVPWPTI